jgi:ATP adenylyltransferase
LEAKPLKRKNLWAPWRVKYIQGLSEKSDCFLCDYLTATDNDKENLVLWRTEHAFVVFNKFPYNNGHLLVAPVRHIASFDDASDAEMLCIMKLVRDCQKVLSLTIEPHGFNVGMNIGRCAGAGLPEHVHMHIVPRWNGDTNYMTVCSNTDVISQSLDDLYDQMIEISQKENLPQV